MELTFLTPFTNGLGYDKRDLKGIKLKIKVLRQKERTGFDEHLLKI